MKTPTPDFLGILRTMVDHRVDFIVIGGVGAVVQGAPVATFDLDLLHSRDPQNVQRLLSALRELGARARSRTDSSRLPDESHRSSLGHQLLMTRCGPLDLLVSVGKGLRRKIEPLDWAPSWSPDGRRPAYCR